MSNFIALTRNPKTGSPEMAEWIDDYYGRHRYGVRFGDGEVYPEHEVVRLEPGTEQE